MPRGITLAHPGMEEGGYVPLAGGPFCFNQIDVLQRRDDRLGISALPATALMDHAAAGGHDAEALAGLIFDRLTRHRPAYVGHDCSRPVIMGIINTTPDSFSDGGDNAAAQTAIASGRRMAEDGAVILDIGGESTRPGADPVSREEEEARITPVIETLAGEGHTVSADTRHTAVMATAITAGAAIINDVGGLRDDGAAQLLAEKNIPAMIMHMQGEPGTMQQNPCYDYAPTDVYDWLEARIDAVEAEGVPRSSLAIDPGFGFGKTPRHNMEIMGSLALYHGLGLPIVLGVSRKSTIGHFSRGEAAKQRLPGSLALAALGRQQGVQIFRVHDVDETRQALALAEVMLTGSG